MNNKIPKMNNAKSPHLLETIGVTKVYKTGNNMVTSMSDVTLSVNAGDFSLIFGSSTSGKTTLLSVMYGVEKPDIGEVLIKGEPLYEFSSTERAYIRLRKFGFIPQSKRWISHLSLLDNVAFPLFLGGTKETLARLKATELLKRFDLIKYSSQSPEKLTSLNQQLAALARALIFDPWIIFADEPYLGLDSQSTEKLMNYLEEVNRVQEIAIIVTANDIRYLEHCRKWFFMDDGRIEDIRKNKRPLERLRKVVGLLEQEEERLKKSDEIPVFI